MQTHQLNRFAKQIALSWICLFFCWNVVFAQSNISGKIRDEQNAPIAHASVLLLHANDSSLHKGVTSNAEGDFSIQDVPEGKYLLVCSYAGMRDHFSEVFQLHQQPLDMGMIRLSHEERELSNITVTAKRPMFEQKIDRLVINVQNSVTSAGSNVLEVLERSPGVIVNRQSGAITLRGKQGANVMINGKLTYMPADALLQLLSGMNASNVEKIELITTPPAKYDAAGNAGFINVVLVANPDEGFNGNYAVSAGFGKGGVHGASLALNYRKKNINLYGNYSFSYDGQDQLFTNSRSVVYQGKKYETDIESVRDPFQRNHDPRIGLDYRISKKTVFGVLLSGYDHRWEMDAVNQSRNFINGLADTSIRIDNHEVNYWRNLMGNMNIQHNFNSKEQLSWNADYLWYKNNNPTDYQNHYYKNGNFLFDEDAMSSKETIMRIFASNIDYSKKINENTDLETGLKTTITQFSNDVLVQTKQNGQWLPRAGFNGKYQMKEDIYAAYISGSTKLGEKTSVKAGLRFEYTISNLGSATEKNIIDRKYGSLFPTFYLSHQLNERNSINLSYNRRISRPGFTQLAPFLIFFDPKTFISGNAALQPAIADGINIDYIYRKWTLSGNYTYTNRPIGMFVAEVDSATNTQTSISKNLNYENTFFVSLSMPLKIAKWWNSQISVSANWDHVNATLQKKETDVKSFFLTVNGAETITLPWNMTFEVSGFYNSRALFGAYIVEPFGRLTVALQKKIPAISGTLTLGVENLLNSFRFNLKSEYPEQQIYSYSSFLFTQRYFKIAWTQSFGNKILAASRSRKTASDDVRQRVN